MLSCKLGLSLLMHGTHSVLEPVGPGCKDLWENVTQKGVLRLARCKTSATHEGL